MLRTSRRGFMATAAAFASAPVLIGGCISSPESRRVPRVGYLIGSTFPTLVAAFREELSKLGYVEGENLILEMRQSRPNTADGSIQAAELAAMDLDLIVAAALPIAIEVRRHNPDMPMVIATGPGLVSNGFARSLQRPGGNTTGMDELPPGLTGKRLRLLKEVAPGVTHVALLSTTPGRGGHEVQLADAEEAAKALGVVVRSYRATSLAELRDAIAAMTRDRIDGLVNFQGALSLINRPLIIDFAEERRVPAVYQSRLFVESGGLMSYAPDQEEQFRIAARYVDRILKGTPPGDLPIQHPARYFLTINRTAAASIGVALSSKVMALADHLIDAPRDRR